MSFRRMVLCGLTAVFVFAYFVIARFPASHGLSLINRISQGNVMYSNASGTIWQGQTEHLYISVQQQLVDLGKTQWQLKALPLLVGKLHLNLDAKLDKQVVKAHIRASSKQAKLEEVSLRMPLAKLLSFAPIPLPIQVSGQLDLDLQSVELNQKEWVKSLNGNLVLQNVVIHMYEDVVLGSYGARLSKEKDELIALVNDIDGTVTVEGQLSTNLLVRSYASDVVLKPKADAAAMIEQTLAMVTRKQNDGRYHFKQNGNF